MSETQFPLLDAVLVTPEDSKTGAIAVCTNATMAPGQVYAEIEPHNAQSVAVLGSLKVNRDGGERMIVNSLIHPSLRYLILFGTETSAFRPSSNLLQALQFGVDPQQANRIVNGHSSNAQYPNLKQDHIDTFRDSITVLPAFMSDAKGTVEIVTNYIGWLRDQGQVDDETIEILSDVNSRPNKIYFDKLNQLLHHLGRYTLLEKPKVRLLAEDFQHLQPPLVSTAEITTKPKMPFSISVADKQICVKLQRGDDILVFQGTDGFALGYSMLEVLGDSRREYTPLEQLTLGAEVGRASAFLQSDIQADGFCTYGKLEGTEIKHALQAQVRLKSDSKYYYMVSLKRGETISVQCLAHDVCEKVYELQSPSAVDLLSAIANDNRFEDYDMDFLHRFDIGMQIGRADIALKGNFEFVQDFDNLIKTNTTDLPFVTVEGDSFLSVHHDLLRDIYTKGLTAEHGDRQKGLARTVAALAIFRSAETSLAEMPRLYKQGEQSTDEMRAEYAKQLLRFDHDGGYSYGERTRSYFGFDQLDSVVDELRMYPTKATIIQRFDPTHDMQFGIDSETGIAQSSEDPCLTHDVYFIKSGRLHAVHIARAHNATNAYPENIFGLHDAYDIKIASELGVQLGDMFMLSSRANILLLTEEQKARRIISAPTKPMEDVDASSGPFYRGDQFKPTTEDVGVFIEQVQLRQNQQRPKSKILDRLESMNGIDTVERAIAYLKGKGVSHNNAILTSYTAHPERSKGEPSPELAFFQANAVGDRLDVTAVFTNSPLSQRVDDTKICNYLATKYAKALQLPLGSLTICTIGEST